ncbi:MAG: histidine phosphatase family protein [Phycisphaerales bacterium]|nr:histidine phosphatase family protein [Phycisphaerales bacterium]
MAIDESIFTLVVARHGKANQDSTTGRDEDRELLERGERQARYLGAAIAERRPGLLLTSDLVRAAQTSGVIMESLSCPWRFEPSLRTGHDAAEVVRVIASERATCGAALVLVGHNPQLEQLLGVLCADRSMRGHQMRTGEAVLVRAPRAGTLMRACEGLDRLRLEGD